MDAPVISTPTQSAPAPDAGALEWHFADSNKVTAELEVKATEGLTSAEAQSRLARYGPNELVERGGKKPWQILLAQFTSKLVLILIVAAVISAVVGDFKDAIAILAIVILNAVLGFAQEYRAEQAMAALKKLATPSVRVRRDGQISDISARELVPGDIVLLEAGNLVPADGRLLEAANLRIQEAILTGESEPVEKQTAALAAGAAAAALGDRRNMAFMGRRWATGATWRLWGRR